MHAYTHSTLCSCMHASARPDVHDCTHDTLTHARTHAGIRRALAQAPPCPPQAVQLPVVRHAACAIASAQEWRAAALANELPCLLAPGIPCQRLNAISHARGRLRKQVTTDTLRGISMIHANGLSHSRMPEAMQAATVTVDNGSVMSSKR